MKKLVCLIAFLSLFLYGKDEIWDSYTCMNNIINAVEVNGKICALSEGGVFFFNPVNKQFDKVTRTEGLESVSYSALYTDGKKVYIGSNEGLIDIIDPTDLTVSHCYEITKSSYSNKKINSISSSGDSLLISTAFGLVILNKNDKTVIDSYLQIGTNDNTTNAKFAEKISNKLYIVTDAGIAIQKDNVKNLSTSDAWNITASFNTANLKNIIKLLKNGNTLAALTSNDLVEITPTVQIKYHYSQLYDVIYNDGYQILTNNSVMKDNANLYNISGFSAKKLIKFNNDFWFVTNTGLRSSNNVVFNPSGPFSNFFYKIAVDKSQNIWATNGFKENSQGFYKYSITSDIWKNFNLQGYHNLFISSDNSVYFANWGGGFIKIKDTLIVDAFNVNNTPFVGIPDNAKYLPIADINEDSQGNLWVLNHQSAIPEILGCYASKKWYMFKNSASDATTIYLGMIIDQYDTKWFYSFDAKGLFYLNENKTFSNTTDDKYGVLSTSNSINSNKIQALAVDKFGELWVGSDKGINIIPDPGNPKQNISNVYNMRSQNISQIIVDPLNRKWVATKTGGIILLSADGYEILANYNSTNSPLPSDNINSIALDSKTGVLYIGTDYGLYSLKTSGVNPEITYNLNVYPNPFYLVDGSKNITIQGLVKDSQVKILSIDNRLVNDFTTEGGGVTKWNGKDKSGNLVASGIYFIVAFDRDGNNISKTKIVVIRK